MFKDRPSGLDHLESIRKDFLGNNDLLGIQDLGAGSAFSAGENRRVKDVAKASLSSPKQCRLLARLVEHISAKNVLEFGSCLGLSAAYMSQAGAAVISMEGSDALYDLARRRFDDSASAPDFRLGDFDKILPGILAEVPRWDLVFIDGNHTHEATLRYFNMLLPHIHADTVLIFDDIHWSVGMESAWEEINSNSKVTLSIDLFWCGMIFFRPGLSGEQFTIRY